MLLKIIVSCANLAVGEVPEMSYSGSLDLPCDPQGLRCVISEGAAKGHGKGDIGASQIQTMVLHLTTPNWPPVNSHS